MSEGILHAANVAHVESLAHDDQAPARAAQLVVDLVGHLCESTGALRQVDLQGHFARRIGQAGGRGNEADLPPHGLHHQHRIGRPGSGILLVGVLHHMQPIAGHRAVAGRVVDQAQLGCRRRRCRSSSARPRPPNPGRTAGPTGRPCWPCPWSRCRQCTRNSPRRGPAEHRSPVENPRPGPF